MAATRVRLQPEYRNGDWNYLDGKLGGDYVPCKDKHEIGPLVAAFYLMCGELGISAKEVRKHMEAHCPSRD